MTTAKGATDYDRAIGARIREARLAQKMSQKVVAQLIGVSYQQLQRYESGADRVAPARIERLVSALNRPLGWFFPNATDVRTSADPMITKFICSKEGYQIASQFFRIPPKARGIVVALVAQLAALDTQ